MLVRIAFLCVLVILPALICLAEAGQVLTTSLPFVGANSKKSTAPLPRAGKVVSVEHKDANILPNGKVSRGKDSGVVASSIEDKKDGADVVRPMRDRNRAQYEFLNKQAGLGR